MMMMMMIGGIRRIGTIGGVNDMSVGGCRCGGVGGGWWRLLLLLLLLMVMRRTTMMTIAITITVVVVVDISTSINIHHICTTHIDIPMHHGGG